MRPRRFLPGASDPRECQHCGHARGRHEPLGACPAPIAGFGDDGPGATAKD